MPIPIEQSVLDWQVIPSTDVDGDRQAMTDVVVVGADTWPVEAVPGEDKDRPFECHQWWIAMNGIYIHENLDLEQLAAERAYEFAYIFSPLRLKGATGSPGNPVAIR